eukprot:50521-Pelagomonas_calceolata.AAC.3
MAQALGDRVGRDMMLTTSDDAVVHISPMTKGASKASGSLKAACLILKEGPCEELDHGAIH